MGPAQLDFTSAGELGGWFYAWCLMSGLLLLPRLLFYATPAVPYHACCYTIRLLFHKAIAIQFKKVI